VRPDAAVEQGSRYSQFSATPQNDLRVASFQ
jgi:hypothetical protein